MPTETSIAAFYDPSVQASIGQQRLRVAEFIINQTKGGKPVCRTQIWEHFTRACDPALSQKSSVARAVNELLEGITFDGRAYDFKMVEAKPYAGRTVEHFCLVLRVQKPLQTAMF